MPNNELQAYSIIVAEKSKLNYFLKHKQYKEAVLSCKKIIKYQAADDETYTTCGMSLYILKRHTESIKYLKKVKDPRYTDHSSFILSEIYFNRKSYYDAFNYLMIYMAGIILNLDENLPEKKEGRESHESVSFRKLMRCMFETQGLESVTDFTKKMYTCFEEPMIYSQLATFYEESGFQKTADFYENKYKKLLKIKNDVYKISI